MSQVAGRRQKHQQILIDVLEAAVNIISELSDQLGSHIVFHAEESQVFT